LADLFQPFQPSMAEIHFFQKHILSRTRVERCKKSAKSRISRKKMASRPYDTGGLEAPQGLNRMGAVLRAS
jgi:hypothetical protein